MSISGNLVDIFQRIIYPGTIRIDRGKIVAIECEDKVYDHYILPGFVDAHVHIESSMLVPAEFARLATVHGTVATISDPHEIANVLGLAGVRFMQSNAAQTPFHIAFGAPSCVPATPFETAGGKLMVQDIQELFDRDGITYLSEMMNIPGVLAQDPEVMAKIRIAQTMGGTIDDHAPGLRGITAQNYIAADISTDHECLSLEEALDKLAAGMKILIREGSAAKNFNTLHSLIDRYPDRCMFCSDDLHPDDLVKGHINLLVKRALALGHDLMNVLQIACVNPVLHYGLKVGLLRVGDSADAIEVNNLQDFEVQRNYCQGVLVAQEGKPLIFPPPTISLNHFVTQPKTTADFRLPAVGKIVRVIHAIDGELITPAQQAIAPITNGEVTADLERDILKITVVNRYFDAPPAVALIKNFHLQRGAIASSVAHDSHNIIAVGTTDAEICSAVNAVIRAHGGIVVVEGDRVQILELPIAGLMSNADGYQVAAQYAHLDRAAKGLGSTLSAPFMTLSFMALLVIPHLKLSDRGLFNGDEFQFTSLWVE